MNRKRKQNKKFDHYFQMSAPKGLYHSGKTVASFIEAKEKKSLPIFNFDGLHFTPSFIVPALYSADTSRYL